MEMSTPIKFEDCTLTGDSAYNNGAILKFNGHGLIIELHQKAYELHYYSLI
jgi:hypothetical protein